MIIKKKSNYNLIIFLILFIIIIFLVSTNFKLSNMKLNLTQYIMTLDPGFSHRMNLVDNGNGLFNNGNVEGDVIYRKKIIKNIIKSIPKIVYYKIFENKFEKLFIDIDFKNYQSLLKDKNTAIKNNGLMNSSFINGNISFKDKNYAAKFKLKGDLISHYNSIYRMSLRVHLKNDQSIKGLVKFSLQKPAERQFPYDHVYQDLSKKIDILSPENKYFHIYVNGTSWGIMNLEEHMNKSLLEKQERKESLIIRLGNDSNFLFHNNNSNLRISDPNLFLQIYENKISENIIFRKYFSYISNLLKNKNYNIYDSDKLIKTFLLSSIWGNYHTLYNNNSRYYFNPYILKLEPITTDQGAIKNLRTQKKLVEVDFPNHYNNLIESKFFKSNYYDELSSIQNNIFNKNNIFKDVNDIFPVDVNKTDFVLKKNLEYLKENIISIDKFKIKNNSTNDEINYNLIDQYIHFKHYDNGKIEIYNLLPREVHISKIIFNKKNIINKDIKLEGIHKTTEPHIIFTSLNGFLDNKIEVYSKINGIEKKAINGITLMDDEIFNPLNTLSIDNNILLVKNKYFIKKGVWYFNKPIILDKDLVISSGAKLIFSSDSFLIVNGSLRAIGNERDPIIMQGNNNYWKGIYVYGSENKSILENVEIKNINFLKYGILNLTGGINFYNSDIQIKNTQISNAISEDALNIVKSNFNIDNLTVKNAKSDAIDFDFSKGVIKNSNLEGINGDGLDFSGSTAEIINIKIKNVEDKGISVGESSNIDITDTTIIDSFIGIVSKDNSKTKINNVNIIRPLEYSLMTFKKKSFYEFPYLEIKNSQFDIKKIINQKGSTFIVDGEKIDGKKFNINSIYN